MSTEREGVVCEYIEFMQIPPRFECEVRVRSSGDKARVTMRCL